MSLLNSDVICSIGLFCWFIYIVHNSIQLKYLIFHFVVTFYFTQLFSVPFVLFYYCNISSIIFELYFMLLNTISSFSFSNVICYCATFILFYSIYYCCNLFCTIIFYCAAFCCVPLYSIVIFYFILLHSI